MTKRQHIVYGVLGTGGAILLVTAALWMHGWYTSVPVASIQIHGLEHGQRNELVRLAGIQKGDPLFEFDPAIIADRVKRHPWVHWAEVDRWPTGTVRIAVRERTPELLALDATGQPTYFVDAAGYRMPAVDAALYDVPLVRGLSEPYHPMRPVEHPALRRLAAVLAQRDDMLLSDVLVEGDEVHAYTPPAAGHGPIRVRLGTDGFDEKLQRLEAFWHQAVVPRPDVALQHIDLRFDGQIVTHEQ